MNLLYAAQTVPDQTTHAQDTTFPWKFNELDIDYQ
jgi:hypothetical protein